MSDVDLPYSCEQERFAWFGEALEKLYVSSKQSFGELFITAESLDCDSADRGYNPTFYRDVSCPPISQEETAAFKHQKYTGFLNARVAFARGER